MEIRTGLVYIKWIPYNLTILFFFTFARFSFGNFSGAEVRETEIQKYYAEKKLLKGRDRSKI